MATYITLLDFTEQGVRNYKQSPQRASDFKAAAQQLGVTVKQVFWTLGAHDGVLIFDAPDEQAAIAAMLNLSSLGYVKTQTLRAFAESEVQAIIEKAS